ncbi:MAG: hypothetical protein AABW51_00265 [Nanoarchaeota archaeon]
MTKIGKQGFLEMSFSWMFALIVGAFILFLAIFFIVKFVNTEQTSSDVQASKSLGIITNPLETLSGESKVTLLALNSQTKIYDSCQGSGEFGEQLVRVNQQALGKYSDSALESSFENKYFFSESIIEDKNFYLFSKPFEFPFKVADLIYIIPQTKIYCFVKPPKDISDEINNLGIKSIINVSKQADCGQNSIDVCFEENCGINVNYNLGYVQKGSDRLYFEGLDKGNALMYGAIFSEKSFYECQVKRLMKKTEKLAEVYESKKGIVQPNGCDSNVNFDSLKSSISSYKDSSDLTPMIFSVNEIKKNNVGVCRLW